MILSVALPSPTLALLDMLGGSELLVIFLLVLIFFGGEKMPEFARGLGKAIREFRKAAAGVEQEFKKAMEDEQPKPNPPVYALPTPTIMPPSPAATPTTPPQPTGNVSGPAAPDAGVTVQPRHDDAADQIAPVSDPLGRQSEPGASLPQPEKKPRPNPGGELDAG